MDPNFFFRGGDRRTKKKDLKEYSSLMCRSVGSGDFEPLQDGEC